jgi:hypothetical protein
MATKATFSFGSHSVCAVMQICGVRAQPSSAPPDDSPKSTLSTLELISGNRDWTVGNAETIFALTENCLDFHLASRPQRFQFVFVPKRGSCGSIWWRICSARWRAACSGRSGCTANRNSSSESSCISKKSMQLRWYSDGSIRWMRSLLITYLENDDLDP